MSKRASSNLRQREAGIVRELEQQQVRLTSEDRHDELQQSPALAAP